jgi:2-oxoglutarate ferredoxin oxidoreductase subunit beta
MVELSDYDTNIRPTWCRGCGNYAVWTGLKNSLKEEGIEPWQMVLVAGIGCHGHIINFTEVNCFEGLHGRPLPVARGVKLANPALTVIVSTGDGDCLGEGGNHFIHTARGNHDLAVIIHDNQVYGLTTGQASPTSERGVFSKSTPAGVIESPVNPIALAIISGATYVARGFSGDIDILTQLVKGAILHKGFAVVDVLQPCVAFNKLNTYKYFYDRVYKLEEDGHDPTDKFAALKRSLEWGQPRSRGGSGIPTGLFYRETKAVYHEQAEPRPDKAPVSDPVKPVDVSALMEKLV